MAVTLTSFRTRYPEFEQAPDTLVQACIDDAEAIIDRNFFGTTKADIAVKAYAAHLIAINPLGEYARLDKKGEKTTYLLQYEKVTRTVPAGCRTI